eukprot:2643023-Amphidinium_carterae.1
MLLAQLSVEHLTYHPQFTDPQALHVHNQHMFDTQYPGIRVFAELILLAFLRSLHIAQEAMCRGIQQYPGTQLHSLHHLHTTRCLRVVEQRERIDHAFDYQWRVASHVNRSTLSQAELQVHQVLTDYSYLCWNLTVYNYNPANPPRYPFLPPADDGTPGNRDDKGKGDGKGKDNK